MFNVEDLKALLAADTNGPFISIYQPTHRQHPDNQQDPIRFRNLVKQAEASLQSEYSKGQVESLLARFHALADDADFWNHTADGLAVFGSADLFRNVRLQRPMPELALVASSFHVRPLLRIVQSADRFQVLSINRRAIRLFEGTRDALDEVELAADVPATITQALGDELTEPHQQKHAYGTGPSAAASGSSRGPGGAKTGGIQHGQGAKRDELDMDADRFFRAVDRAITEHYSKPSGLPLILAGLAEYHAPFRAVSHNPQLVDAGIEINIDALSLDELRERAWQVLLPHYLQRLEALLDRFGAARATGRGAERLSDVAAATSGGRVDTLLLEADRRIAGRVDPETGTVTTGDLSDPDMDDVLDDLAEGVIRSGGEVVIVPADRMPSSTGLAAIYRY